MAIPRSVNRDAALGLDRDKMRSLVIALYYELDGAPHPTEMRLASKRSAVKELA
jgi:hypothetical protein